MCRQPEPRADESKQLLSCVGKRLNLTSISVYEKFLLEAQHCKINLQSLISAAAGSPRIIEGFYAAHDDQLPPKYFSLYNPTALTMLQQNVLTKQETTLILIYCKEPVSEKGQEGDYYMFFDGRVQSMRNSNVALQPLVIIIRPEVKNRRRRYLAEASPQIVSKFQMGIINPLCNLDDLQDLIVCSSMGSVFARLFDARELEGLSWVDSLMKLPHLPSTNNSYSLLCYYGTAINVRKLAWTKRLENGFFHSWGRFYTGENAPSDSEIVIISPFYDSAQPGKCSAVIWQLDKNVAKTLHFKLSTPSIPYSPPMVNEEALAMIGTASKKRRDNSRIQELMRRKFELLEERQTLLAYGDDDTFDAGEDEERPRLIRDHIERSPLFDVEDELDAIDASLKSAEIVDCHFKVSTERWSCSCNYCTSSFTDEGWRDVAPSGPQRGVYYSDTSVEFLEKLNIDSKDFRERIRKACRLSVATFDIETMTHYNKGNLSAALRVEPVVEQGVQSEEIQATLIPQMIGFCCNGVLSKEVDYAAFSIENDEPDERPMMERFIIHVFKMQEKMENLKRQLLRPILDSLDEWKTRHLAFFPSDSTTPYAVQESLFRLSPAGKFKNHLDRMIKFMYIYSFNGSAFDNCALFPHMAMFVKTHFPKSRFHTQSDGLKIKKILCPNKGVIFSDAKMYLSAGASLAQMLKTVLNNTECEKGIFPHGLFTSREFLKRTELPKDATQWRDPLRPDRTVSQEAVDEAIKEFKRRNCRTIGDYEHYYMFRDCELLQFALHKLFDSFEEIIGLDAIDARKLSISSLAAAGVQIELKRQKSYAYFSPNCRPLLKALHDASTGNLVLMNSLSVNTTISFLGGLTMVMKSQGFIQKDAELNKANVKHSDFEALWATLKDREKNRDKDVFVDFDETDPDTTVKAFDVASLYPASGKKSVVSTTPSFQKCVLSAENQG